MNIHKDVGGRQRTVIGFISTSTIRDIYHRKVVIYTPWRGVFDIILCDIVK